VKRKIPAKRERFADETGAPLTKRIIEALDVASETGCLETTAWRGDGKTFPQLSQPSVKKSARRRYAVGSESRKSRHPASVRSPI
jgi:hypothetical protein